MISERQQDANRRNAAKSHGPKTPEGPFRRPRGFRRTKKCDLAIQPGGREDLSQGLQKTHRPSSCLTWDQGFVFPSRTCLRAWRSFLASAGVSPVLNPASRRTRFGTTSGVLFLTVTVMLGKRHEVTFAFSLGCVGHFRQTLFPSGTTEMSPRGPYDLILKTYGSDSVTSTQTGWALSGNSSFSPGT
jgi:hypothetical protein